MNNYQEKDVSGQSNWLFRRFDCVERPGESTKQFFPTRREILCQPKNKKFNTAKRYTVINTIENYITYIIILCIVNDDNNNK